MNDNILYRFAKDLSQLYAKTQIRGIEDCFIKVAQALESEVEEWLSKAITLGYKSNLKKPEVLDTLKLLSSLKKQYPAGISAPEFIKVFVNDATSGSGSSIAQGGLKFFTSIIVALRQIANSGNYAILSPYKGILDASINIPSASGADVATIDQDIITLDKLFRDDMERKVNSVYDDTVPTKRKTSKKEKMAGMLNYLTRRFGEEISIAYEQIGQIDAAGLTEDPLTLMNPVKIIKTLFPSYPPENIRRLFEKSNVISKEAMKFTDPQYYDYVYNYVRNSVFKEAAFITKDQYNEFKYDSVFMLQSLQGGEAEEMESIKVDPKYWTASYVLILLSMVLYSIAKKSQ